MLLNSYALMVDCGHNSRPDFCPEELYDSVVMQCWQYQPEDRPNFYQCYDMVCDLLTFVPDDLPLPPVKKDSDDEGSADEGAISTETGDADATRALESPEAGAATSAHVENDYVESSTIAAATGGVARRPVLRAAYAPAPGMAVSTEFGPGEIVHDRALSVGETGLAPPPRNHPGGYSMVPPPRFRNVPSAWSRPPPRPGAGYSRLPPPPGWRPGMAPGYSPLPPPGWRGPGLPPSGWRPGPPPRGAVRFRPPPGWRPGMPMPAPGPMHKSPMPRSGNSKLPSSGGPHLRAATRPPGHGGPAGGVPGASNDVNSSNDDSAINPGGDGLRDRAESTSGFAKVDGYGESSVDGAPLSGLESSGEGGLGRTRQAPSMKLRPGSSDAAA